MAFKHIWSHSAPVTFLKRRRGFTLIELLVTTGILVIVTAILLANNREFGGRILLENLAYDVALTIRQAQAYGISVRQFNTGGAGSFSVGYGMHFATANPKSYNLFGDVDLDGKWDAGGGLETEEDVPPSPYSIERGYYIGGLCAPAGDPDTCLATYPVERLDFIFKRPEPDACISADQGSALTGEYQCTAGLESARIILKSPRGDQVSVVIERSGQISVE